MFALISFYALISKLFVPNVYFYFYKIVLKYVNLTDGSPAPSTSTARVTRVTKRDKRLLKMDWKKKKSSNGAGNKLKKMRISCVPTADCLEEEACREMD